MTFVEFPLFLFLFFIDWPSSTDWKFCHIFFIFFTSLTATHGFESVVWCGSYRKCVPWIHAVPACFATSFMENLAKQSFAHACVCVCEFHCRTQNIYQIFVCSVYDIITITYDTHNLSRCLTLVTALRMYNKNGEKNNKTFCHSSTENSRTYTWWYAHKHVHVWRKNAALVISVYAAFPIHSPFPCYL